MKKIKGGAGMRKTFLSSLIVASLLCGGVPVGLAQTPSGPVRMPSSLARMVNKPAPEFNLALLSDGKVELKDFRGRVVVLNFWHSA